MWIELDYTLSDGVSSFMNENAVINSVGRPHFIYHALIQLIRADNSLTSVYPFSFMHI